MYQKVVSNKKRNHKTKAGVVRGRISSSVTLSKQTVRLSYSVYVVMYFD